MGKYSPFTFAEDLLNLKPFSETLERFLNVEHEFVEGSLVVSLNAPFGSGKSTFLRMWKSDLAARRQKDGSCPLTITLNAWETDYCGDPLLAIVSGLLEAINDDKSKVEAKSRLREAAKDVAWFAIGAANGVASHFTGVDLIAAGDLANQKKERRIETKIDFVDRFEKRLASLKRLKETLKDVFGCGVPQAYVFVDELDRCRPDYAISYLETIKHIFDVHGLVFVISIDVTQLGNSASALFGAGLNRSEYLRKFIHRSVSLPRIEVGSFNKVVSAYVAQYLENGDSRASMLDLGVYLRNIKQIVASFNMTLRQTQEFFRIVGHVASCDNQKRGSLLWCLGVGTILMSLLKIQNPELYEAIGNGRGSHIDVCKLIMHRVGAKDGEWWVMVYLTASRVNEEYGNNDIEGVLRELGYLGNDDNLEYSEIVQFNNGWGNSTRGRFQQIYKAIESATSFGMLP